MQGEPQAWSVGGEAVSFVVNLRTCRAIENLIVGFIVKNKQGLPLFGDNTYLSYLEHGVSCAEDQDWIARFDFRMPILPAGEYAISVAVSDGSQQDHVVHQWVHDALIITSHSSQISTGLVGIPMRRIELTRVGGS
jgi:lipopolysaccharide transport system ATP-binding protein